LPLFWWGETCCREPHHAWTPHAAKAARHWLKRRERRPRPVTLDPEELRRWSRDFYIPGREEALLSILPFWSISSGPTPRDIHNVGIVPAALLAADSGRLTPRAAQPSLATSPKMQLGKHPQTEPSWRPEPINTQPRCVASPLGSWRDRGAC